MKRCDGLDITTLKLSSATETQIWIDTSEWEGESLHATRFTSIWFVKQRDFYGAKKLSSRRLKSSVWRALNLFR